MSLTSFLRVAPDERQYEIIVDVGADSVLITTGAGNNEYSGFFGGVDVPEFVIGETVNILEAGIVIPHGLCVSEPCMYNIEGRPTGAGPPVVFYESIMAPSFGSNEPLKKNFSLEPVQNVVGILSRSTFNFTLENLGVASVSMAGLPTSLDGDTIKLIPYMLLQHNFPLTV